MIAVTPLRSALGIIACGLALLSPASALATNGARATAKTTDAADTLRADTRPVVAIVGDSAGAELTDLVVPRATLALSGVARVITVSSAWAAIPLVPGKLRLAPDMTFAHFDSVYAPGAAYVIVPALVDRDNPAVRAWLREQARRGATIVSICDGAWTVAGAGLFDGRRATSHWHSLPGLAEKYPGTTWVRDARYVQDGRRISTTGVSASLPVSIYLIAQIAGRDVADSIARLIGVTAWDPTHHTADFAVTKWMYVKGALNYLAWWRHDPIAVPARDGVDEIALALTLDAIPRTMRGRPFVQLDSGTTVTGRQGLRFVVEPGPRSVDAGVKVIRLPGATVPPVDALRDVIARMREWYGSDAATLIEMGMEIPPRER